jgi:hypothetical protein
MVVVRRSHLELAGHIVGEVVLHMAPVADRTAVAGELHMKVLETRTAVGEAHRMVELGRTALEAVDRMGAAEEGMVVGHTAQEAGRRNLAAEGDILEEDTVLAEAGHMLAVVEEDSDRTEVAGNLIAVSASHTQLCRIASTYDLGAAGRRREDIRLGMPCYLLLQLRGSVCDAGGRRAGGESGQRVEDKDGSVYMGGSYSSVQATVCTLRATYPSPINV